MASFDLSLAELKKYKPGLTREKDFGAFWKRTLDESSGQPLNAKLEKISHPARGVNCYELTYDGYKNGKIRGWYILPAGKKRIPAIIQFHGYNGRSDGIFAYLAWVYQGYAFLALNVRGQEGSSTDGNEYPVPTGMHCLTKGIGSPETYFYRFAYADCARAVEFLHSRKEIDPKRIALTGASQGGGLTLATSALCGKKIKLAAAHIPFLCNFPRNVDIAPEYPYPEISDFLTINPKMKEAAFRTLSYFDCMNLSPEITSRTLVTSGLQDGICPPSGIFSAYNHMKCEKEILAYDYLKHDVRDYIFEETFAWMKKYL